MPIVVGTGGSGASSDITTYAGLVTAVGTWLNRTDLDAMVPNFIALLEARLNRILRVPEMEANDTLTPADGVATLPTDWLQIRHVYIDASCDTEVVPVPYSTIRRDYPLASTGRPQVYAVHENEIHLAPLPSDDAEEELTVLYYEKIPALSAQNTTNWLSESHPDIYLYGALVMAEAYIWDDERLHTLWRPAFDEAIGELQRQGTKKHHGGGPLFPRPIPRAGAAS
jgi:hypothetical protein